MSMTTTSPAESLLPGGDDLSPDEAQPSEVIDFLDESDSAAPQPFPNPIWHPLRSMAWCVRTLFGIASLIVLLALLAAIPLVNFLALGYLLEAEGRVARTGKFRSAFHLVGVAPRIGAIAICTWLWMLPLRFLSGLASDAAIISPGSETAHAWRTGTLVAAVVVGLHLVLALARGGSFGCFFRPLKNTLWLTKQLRAGSYWEQADKHLRAFIASLRLKHHFLLGVKGFFGALPWLVPPTLLFAAANSSEGGRILLTLIGGVALVVVFGWMPFLQARVASTGRMSAYRELSAARRVWSHAPIAAWIALLFTFALALPLNLLKIKLLPQDAMWVATLVFIVSIYPARIITGWACHRGSRPDRKPAWSPIRWGMRLLGVGVLVVYTFLFFFVQDISQHGKLALFEHHAFLLPVPF